MLFIDLRCILLFLNLGLVGVGLVVMFVNVFVCGCLVCFDLVGFGCCLFVSSRFVFGLVVVEVVCLLFCNVVDLSVCLTW